MDLDARIRHQIYTAATSRGKPPTIAALCDATREPLDTRPRLARAPRLVAHHRPAARERRDSDGAAFLRRADAVRRRDRESLVVCELRLGRDRRADHAAAAGPDRQQLRLLRRVADARGRARSPTGRRRHRALRRARGALVGRSRLHLKDDAVLPGGRARGPMVRAMESAAWRDDVDRPGVASGARVVSGGPRRRGVAAAGDRRSRVAVRVAWLHWAILATAIVRRRAA